MKKSIYTSVGLRLAGAAVALLLTSSVALAQSGGSVENPLGGPTANMWRLACNSKEVEAKCRKLSCVFPGICKNLNTDQAPLVSLYRRARGVQGIKKVLIASGRATE